MNSVIPRQYGDHDNLRDAMAEAWHSDEDPIGSCCRVALQAAEYAKDDGRRSTMAITKSITELWKVDDRQRAIRAVVAAQWAVACTVVDWGALTDSESREFLSYASGDIAALPAAEQIVDGAA